MNLKEALRAIILEKVAGACKATELVVYVTSTILTNPLYQTVKDEFENVHDVMFDVIDSLITSGDIIEIEYVLPDQDYRAKSFFVPKGSKLRIINISDLSTVRMPYQPIIVSKRV